MGGLNHGGSQRQICEDRDNRFITLTKQPQIPNQQLFLIPSTIPVFKLNGPKPKLTKIDHLVNKKNDALVLQKKDRETKIALSYSDLDNILQIDRMLWAERDVDDRNQEQTQNHNQNQNKNLKDKKIGKMPRLVPVVAAKKIQNSNYFDLRH